MLTSKQLPEVNRNIQAHL